MKTHDIVNMMLMLAMGLTIFYLAMLRQDDLKAIADLEAENDDLLEQLVVEDQRRAAKVVIEKLIIDGDTLVYGKVHYEAFDKRMEMLGLLGDSIIVGGQDNVWKQDSDGVVRQLPQGAWGR